MSHTPDPFKKHVCHYCGFVIDLSHENPTVIGQYSWHEKCVKAEFARREEEDAERGGNTPVDDAKGKYEPGSRE